MSIDVQVEALPEAVGRRVRAARAARGWTLDQLAEISGVSRRMIVNVEGGRGHASIATLLRLATALHVALAELVSDGSSDHAVSITPAADQTPLWRGESGGAAVMVASASTPDMLELWEWMLQPGEAYRSEPHRRGTCELLHVLSGVLRLSVDGDDHDVRAGDAVSFDADVPHAYANIGRRPVRFTMAVHEPLPRVRP